MKEKQPFERLVLTKEEALDMFASNKYKVELIKEKVAEVPPLSPFPSLPVSSGLHDHCLQVWSSHRPLQGTPHPSHWQGRRLHRLEELLLLLEG